MIAMLLQSQRLKELTDPRYVNFAYGDETNDVVYNTSTPRLREIKAKYDPHDVFNQWFNILPVRTEKNMSLRL